VAVNAANRKEVTFTFTADSGPKVEIAYEEEVKVESGVVAAVKTEVDMQVKEELVDVQVKEEPLDMQVKEEPGA
jgi:mevalonate pyrophosphate decarboxylase